MAVDSMRPRRAWIGLIVLIAICLTAAGAGGLVTRPNIQSWYANLAKPAWTPPDWVFGPVWTGLYLSMAVAAWLVWRQGGMARAYRALALFTTQLMLNVAWSCLFFGLHSPGAGLIDILLLWAAIAATASSFWSRSVWAGVLLLPYLAWVTFAAGLNGAVWWLNR